MRRSGLCFVVLSILFFSQCQTDLIVDENPSLGVDQRLIKYFNLFEMEGKARGLEVNLATEGITGSIREIQTPNVAGQCQYGSHLSPAVIIDSEFWNEASEHIKEMIVFHELGHCYLKRGHKEDRFTNGVCQSIMRSGDGSCFDNYRTETRAYYLDELFLGN